MLDMRTRRILATAREPWQRRTCGKAEGQDCSAITKNPEMHQQRLECGWKGGAMWCVGERASRKVSSFRFAIKF
jgi:hypothetical protein